MFENCKLKIQWDKDNHQTFYELKDYKYGIMAQHHHNTYCCGFDIIGKLNFYEVKRFKLEECEFLGAQSSPVQDIDHISKEVIVPYFNLLLSIIYEDEGFNSVLVSDVVKREQYGNRESDTNYILKGIKYKKCINTFYNRRSDRDVRLYQIHSYDFYPHSYDFFKNIFGREDKYIYKIENIREV